MAGSQSSGGAGCSAGPVHSRPTFFHKTSLSGQAINTSAVVTPAADNQSLPLALITSLFFKASDSARYNPAMAVNAKSAGPSGWNLRASPISSPPIAIQERVIPQNRQGSPVSSRNGQKRIDGKDASTDESLAWESGANITDIDSIANSPVNIGASTRSMAAR